MNDLKEGRKADIKKKFRTVIAVLLVALKSEKI